MMWVKNRTYFQGLLLTATALWSKKGKQLRPDDPMYMYLEIGWKKIPMYANNDALVLAHCTLLRFSKFTLSQIYYKQYIYFDYGSDKDSLHSMVKFISLWCLMLYLKDILQSQNNFLLLLCMVLSIHSMPLLKSAPHHKKG